MAGVLLGLTVLLVSSCSVNVKKDNQGEDKNVDIKTPFAEIHVDQGADVRDTGLPVYAGARLKQKSGNEEKNANVNISAFGYGVRVVAVEYESDDPPSKVLAFYQGQLKRYGSVLECRTEGTHYRAEQNAGGHDSSGSQELKCEGDNTGNTVELKAGVKSNQHVVSIEPHGKGSNFALVYVHTRSKDDTI
jgi:hypothetical protein